MKNSAKLFRPLQLLFVLFLGALALWWRLQHPGFKGNSVNVAAAFDSPISAKEIFSGGRSFEPKRWREAVGLVDASISLGSAKLSWSTGGNGGCGYLYFTDHSPEPPWEFAPCEQRALKDVTLADAKHEFFGADAPSGHEALSAHWTGTNSITVCEGTLLLARQVGIPHKVYAIEIAKQELNRVEVRYKIFDDVGRWAR